MFLWYVTSNDFRNPGPKLGKKSCFEFFCGKRSQNFPKKQFE